MQVGNKLNKTIKNMKKIFKYFSFLPILAIMLASCSPEEYILGDKDVESGDLVEGIAFKIEHDATNPNIIHLTSLMGPEYTPLWNHPQGRSQADKVTLEIPFAGTYDVQFGVETRGGIVYGDTVTFKVDNLYAGFISDPMWAMISGGADKEKTWLLDLDAEGTSRFFKGPIYFFTKTYTWDNLHYSTGESYLDGDLNEEFVWNPSKAITPNMTDGAATWYWLADWAGNSWMCTKADFGTMIFDLKGGANVTVDQEAYGLGKSTGQYMLDTENHIITFNGVYPLHDSNRDGEIKTATQFRILYLTEDFMQIIVDPTGVVYNYISKDYKDNWVPGVVVEPEPALPAGWQLAISQTVNKSVKWVLSPLTPFNWANPDGSFMNDWTSPETYASWTGFTAASAADYANFSLTLNSENNSAVYVAPDGTSTSGTYTLDEKGIYTFTDIKPNFVICGGWVTLTTTDANQWRITKIEKDLTGAISGMWVGKRDPVKAEYMVYHLIPQAAGGGSTEPKGTVVTFDNTKLLFGDLESKGNLRLELYNEYGGTKANPPLNITDIKFSNRMEITFNLQGIVLKAGAVGTYKAAISFADTDWSPAYWGGGDGDVSVNGDGTYTVWFEPGAATEGAVVFVIDITGIATDITDMTAVKANINKLILF